MVRHEMKLCDWSDMKYRSPISSPVMHASIASGTFMSTVNNLRSTYRDELKDEELNAFASEYCQSYYRSKVYSSRSCLLFLHYWCKRTATLHLCYDNVLMKQTELKRACNQMSIKYDKQFQA